VDAEQWRPFLKRWSEEWIAAHDPENDLPLDEAVVRDGWLGFTPASEEEIAAAEARLGVSFPPSLREFLAVTNGWRDAGNFIYQLAGTAELGWLRDLDPGWIDSFGAAMDEGLDEDDEYEGVTPMLRRALQLSLDGDAAVMFLDPGDVDADGEWAGYWLASWAGEGPRWFASFYDLMYGQYKSFHALDHPAGETRDQWDAKIEQARLDALGGDVDGPLAVLKEAEEFGRKRAYLLRFQMLAMVGDWNGLPPNYFHDWRDPLFTGEILPLLFAEDRLTGRSHGLASLERLMEGTADEARLAIAEYQAQVREPGFRVNYGNPEFDAAVRDIADGPAEDAWPALLDAIRLWQPRTDDHIAPIVLFADPVLAEIITEDRGREILSMPRGRR
jgi:hypothetical protein